MPVAHSFIGDLSDRGPARAHPSRLRTTIAACLLVLWCLLLPPLLMLLRLLSRPGALALQQMFHAGVARLFGLRIAVQGRPRRQGGTLYVANHASYLDLFVLGQILDASFVAKAEVANWPVLGILARLQNTLFFERDPRRSREQIDILKGLLADGHNLILFPEGTSSDGVRVQPFRSTLLAAVTDTPGAAVQAITIAYTRYDDAPMAPADRDYYAWYLPMTFLPHFLYGMGLRRADVEVHFHQAITQDEITDRKTLARTLEGQVREGLSRALGDAFVATGAAIPESAARRPTTAAPGAARQ